MTNETIELRTTELGMRYFRNVTGDLFASGDTITSHITNDFGLSSTPIGIALMAVDRYPAGEPCDT